jgi:hypothetical protein
MPLKDISKSIEKNRTIIQKTLAKNNNLNVIDTVFIWLDKASYDFTSLTTQQKASIQRLAAVLDLPLIQLIFEKRDDGLKHPYGYGDQKDTMKKYDYKQLIALAMNDVPLNMRIEQTFDFLSEFRYFSPSQSQYDFFDDGEEEDETSPFNTPGTLEYQLQTVVIDFCHTQIKRINTPKDEKGFKALLLTLKTKGADIIWDSIKNDIAYQIELGDNHSYKKYIDLMREASDVRMIPLTELPDFEDVLDKSKNHQTSQRDLVPRQTFWANSTEKTSERISQPSISSHSPD